MFVQSDNVDGPHRFPWKGRAAVLCPHDRFQFWISERNVAKTSPIEFFNQVKTETKKVVWPTRRETVMTAVMVLIMTTVLGLFFFGIDTLFDVIVRALLSLAG